MKIKATTTKSPGSDSNQDALQTHLKEVSFKRGIEQQEGKKWRRRKRKKKCHDVTKLREGEAGDGEVQKRTYL